MTQLNDPGRSLELPHAPYFYGWRPICSQGEDGSTVLENIPLTQEDVLHPQEGDVIVQNTAHDRDTVYLRDVFRNRLLPDPGALVLHDAGVDLGLLNTRMVCPDVCVVRGVKDRDAARGSFDIVAEGARPELIIEVVSPSTRGNDFGKKIELYHRALVPVYVIVDRWDMEGPVSLHGYRLAPDRYETLEPDERGRLWLESVGLWLGVGTNRVVCYDGDTEVGDYDEVTRRLIEADQAREAAEARALRDQEACAAAEARAAEKERAREAAEARAAEEERAREAAEARAAEKERAREAAEARAAEEERAREAAEEKATQEQRARADAEAKATQEQRARADAEAKATQEQRAREAAEAKAAQEQRARQAAEAQLAELQARLAALEASGGTADPSRP